METTPRKTAITSQAELCPEQLITVVKGYGPVEDLAHQAARSFDAEILAEIRAVQERLLFNMANGGAMSDTVELSDGIEYHFPSDLYAEIPLSKVFYADQAGGRQGTIRIDVIAGVVTVVLEVQL